MDGPWTQYQSAEGGPWDKYAAPADQGSSVGGIAKSLGVGLAQGALGIAGLPADLAHLYAPNQNDPNPLGSAGLQNKVEQYTGDFYKPQGALEETAAKIGQFAPAVIGGPESMGAKVLQRVVGPAVGSEVAKKATEGTALEPYAEVAGALAGGPATTAAANRFMEMAAARRAANAIPDLADIRADARGNYQHPAVQAVRINPDALDNLAGNIEHDLQHGQNSGFRAANEPGVFNAVNELRLAQQEGRPATIADIDSVRQVLRNLGTERDAQGALTRQAVAANRASRQIDNFLPNLQQPDLLAGNAAQANGLLQDARRNWNQYKKGQDVERLLGNAQLNAASANSGGNLQNSIKQAFKPLLRNNEAKANSAGFTDEEIANLNRIVRGTWTGSIARAAGNLLGGGGGLGMLAGGVAGYEAGGPAGAIGAGLAGRGLKMIGNASTMRAVRDLDRLIRSNSPVAIRVAAQMPQIAQRLPARSVRLLTGMIAANPVLSQQINQSRQ